MKDANPNLNQQDLFSHKCPLLLTQSLKCVLYSFESSAYILTLFLTDCGRSWINIANKVGPITLPCGASLYTGTQSHVTPFTTTPGSTCEEITKPMQSLITYSKIFNLVNNLWCGSLSKAFWKSNYHIYIGSLVYNLSPIFMAVYKLWFYGFSRHKTVR